MSLDKMDHERHQTASAQFVHQPLASIEQPWYGTYEEQEGRVSAQGSVFREASGCSQACVPCAARCAVIAGVRDRHWRELQSLLFQTPLADGQAEAARKADLAAATVRWAAAEQVHARFRPVGVPAPAVAHQSRAEALRTCPPARSRSGVRPEA